MLGVAYHMQLLAAASVMVFLRSVNTLQSLALQHDFVGILSPRFSQSVT